MARRKSGGGSGGAYEIQVVPGSEFKKTADALRNIDKALPTKLRQELRKAVKPMVADAKSNVKNMTVGGQAGTTGLRKLVARGVTVQVATGRVARLRIVTKTPTGSMAAIPRGLASEKGWRHPVFGNTDTWVTEKFGVNWFMSAMADNSKEVNVRVQKILEEAKLYIKEHGHQ